jgi:hypothetical protein
LIDQDLEGVAGDFLPFFSVSENVLDPHSVTASDLMIRNFSLFQQMLKIWA